MKPDSISEELLTRCLAPDGQMGGIGSDNMTVIIIVFFNSVPEGYMEALGESTLNETSYYLPKDDAKNCVAQKNYYEKPPSKYNFMSNSWTIYYIINFDLRGVSGNVKNKSFFVKFVVIKRMLFNLIFSFTEYYMTLVMVYDFFLTINLK